MERPPLDLPAGITACLFDLDGVLTRTSDVHAAAWKEMFDAFFAARAAGADAADDGTADAGAASPGDGTAGDELRPFELPADYAAHVDGRLRQDGVRAFLASRGLELPEGDPDDPPTAETVRGLGNRKNELVLELLHRDGVERFDGSIRLVEAVRDAGLRRAVVSASRSCRDVLVAAGIEDLFEVRVDGITAAERDLPGKPAPDLFLAAADELGVAPEACAVFEDAVAGVEAGRAGGFGWVVGVDRAGQAEALAGAGADRVVADLGELLAAR